MLSFRRSAIFTSTKGISYEPTTRFSVFLFRPACLPGYVVAELNLRVKEVLSLLSVLLKRGFGLPAISALSRLAFFRLVKKAFNLVLLGPFL